MTQSNPAEQSPTGYPKRWRMLGTRHSLAKADGELYTDKHFGIDSADTYFDVQQNLKILHRKHGRQRQESPRTSPRSYISRRMPHTVNRAANKRTTQKEIQRFQDESMQVKIEKHLERLQRELLVQQSAESLVKELCDELIRSHKMNADTPQRQALFAHSQILLSQTSEREVLCVFFSFYCSVPQAKRDNFTTGFVDDIKVGKDVDELLLKYGWLPLFTS